jgi:hypothetical protein
MGDTNDLSLAMWLLCGIRPGTALQLAPLTVVPSDYKADYPAALDEKRAREAVVRVLQTDSDERTAVLKALAALFSPVPTGHPFAEKIIELKYRSEGKPAKARRNQAICIAVEGLHEHAGLSYNKAYARIAKAHHLTPQTIKDIYLEWRKN